MKETLQKICDRNKFEYSKYSEGLFGNFTATITRKDRKDFKVHIEISESLTIGEMLLEAKIYKRFNLRKP